MALTPFQMPSTLNRASSQSDIFQTGLQTPSQVNREATPNDVAPDSRRHAKAVDAWEEGLCSDNPQEVCHTPPKMPWADVASKMWHSCLSNGTHRNRAALRASSGDGKRDR